jgi:hypothetical protein
MKTPDFNGGKRLPKDKLNVEDILRRFDIDQEKKITGEIGNGNGPEKFIPETEEQYYERKRVEGGDPEKNFVPIEEVPDPSAEKRIKSVIFRKEKK